MKKLTEEEIEEIFEDELIEQLENRTMEEKVEELAEQLRQTSYREMVKRADKTVNPDKVYQMWYQQNPKNKFIEKARSILLENGGIGVC